MLSVELTNLAQILDHAGQLRNVSQQAKEWSSKIESAIWKTTVQSFCISIPRFAHLCKVVDNIFAYETNGKQPVLIEPSQHEV